MAGFDKKRGPQPSSTKSDEKVEQLECEVNRMKDVIAEITAEYVAFKKSNRDGLIGSSPGTSTFCF
ncbi:MAG: hypothetical protein ACLGGX_10060 [Bdellovibrionia bacterium]